MAVDGRNSSFHKAECEPNPSSSREEDKDVWKGFNSDEYRKKTVSTVMSTERDY